MTSKRTTLLGFVRPCGRAFFANKSRHIKNAVWLRCCSIKPEKQVQGFAAENRARCLLWDRWAEGTAATALPSDGRPPRPAGPSHEPTLPSPPPSTELPPVLRLAVERRTQTQGCCLIFSTPVVRNRMEIPKAGKRVRCWAGDRKLMTCPTPARDSVPG